MQENTTISVRVSRPMRLKLKRLGIKPSVMVKEALEAEIRKRELAALSKKAEKLSGLFKRLSAKQVAEDIREDRDSR